MRKITRIQEITVETHSVTIIRTRGFQATTFCQNCEQWVKAFPVEQIAAVLQKNAVEIFDLIERGELHPAETENARMLICGGTEDGVIRLESFEDKNSNTTGSTKSTIRISD